jgi:group I intron endonuclease
MYMIIYLVTNLINQMKYVGQTIRTLKQRKSSHLSSSKKGSTYYLHRAIRKYGAENFKWEVIYNASSEEELNEKETFFIKEYNTNSQDGYNLTEGGRGIRGWKHSELTKEKIKQCAIKNNSAQYLKKFVQSEEGRKKISLMQLGKTYEMKFGKEKAKQMIKDKQRLYNDKYGLQKSSEIREKISKNSKSGLQVVRTKMSESHKKNLDINGKRIDITDQGREKMKNHMIGSKNPCYKHVDENMITSLIFDYQSTKKVTNEMAKKHGISKYLIIRVLKQKGIYERKRQNKANHNNS